MIEAVSTNGLLAAVFGPGKASAQRVGGRGGSQDGASGEALSRTAAYGQPVDVVELSGQVKPANAGKSGVVGSGSAAAEGNAGQADAGNPGIAGQDLSQEEEKQVRELKQRDTEVRRHEQAHKSAAGGNATGGPTFEYQTGPDGKRYAVGGEVTIDTSTVSGDPQGTIQKMQQIRRAALAPAQPSGQDRAVAAQAQAAEREARAELAKERRDDQAGASSKTGERDAGSGFQLRGFQNQTTPTGELLDLVA